jgi:hypothetical protein
MKKYILFYLTGLTSIWLFNNLLTGVSTNGVIPVLLTGVFISLSIWFTEYIVQQLTKKNMTIFVVVGIIISFFTLYIASLIIPGFTVESGNLVFFFTIRGLDSILTLLISSTVVMGIAFLTNWSTIGLE